MGIEFPVIQLGDHVEKIGSGATPRGGSNVYQNTGIALIRSQNVYNNVFSYGGLAFIGAEHAQQLQSVEVKEGDVLLNITGDSVARACQVPADVLPARVNQHVAIIRTRKEYLDPRFLLYYLTSPQMQNYMLALAAAGGTRNALTKGMIENFYIPAPDIHEQRAIAHILGTLDDKIELNQRMNATLEAIARAIFKSWFVDFDPVHAKARGEQPYGMDADTAALFPDAFEDSELGPIPAGWGVGDFGKLISQQKERLRERKATVLSAVAAGELVRSSEHFTKQVYSKDISKYIAVEQWDFAYNPSRINIGSIGMLKEPIIGAVSPVYVVFRPKPTFHWFLEFSLKQPYAQKWIVTLASGSVRQALSFRDFASIPCVIPPDAIIGTFNQTWNSLYDGIVAHTRESSTLAELRDALLPKLISGEIRVSEAEALSGDRML